MSMKLSTPQKKGLLQDARQLMGHLKTMPMRPVREEERERVINMSSLALSYLLRGHSLSEFKELLQADHASDVSQKHWQPFVSQLQPFLTKLKKDVPEEQHRQAVLYLLGWLHRLRPRHRRGST